MQIKTYQNISEIPADEWNSISPKEALFHSHHFLEALDKSKVEAAEMEFLLIKKGDKLLTTCVLSLFAIQLDLFIGESKFISWLKKRFPNVFKINILFCGTPISAGHKNLYCKVKKELPAVTKAIATYMDKKCQSEGIKYAVFKEFTTEEATQLHFLADFNYFKAYSLPSAELPLHADTYEQYWQSLRATYRRQIKASLQKINSKRPIFIDKYFDANQAETHPVFTILEAKKYDTAAFFHLYTKVMSRAEVKLETLNASFFEETFQAMYREFKILAMVFKGKILGVFVLAKIGTELTFIWTGKEKDKDIYNTYANLMNAMVFYGIQAHCTKIIMGQTAYYPKQRMGAEIHDLFIYFKCYLGWKNSLLRRLNTVIFPKLTLTTLRVFKD